MILLKDLVKEYFPDEKIQKESKVKLSDKYLLNKAGKLFMPSGNISLSDTVYSDFIVTMIETDKKIYFDRRGFPKDLWFRLFKNPLILIFYLLIIVFISYMFLSFSILLKIIAF